MRHNTIIEPCTEEDLFYPVYYSNMQPVQFYCYKVKSCWGPIYSQRNSDLERIRHEPFSRNKHRTPLVRPYLLQQLFVTLVLLTAINAETVRLLLLLLPPLRCEVNLQCPQQAHARRLERGRGGGRDRQIEANASREQRVPMQRSVNLARHAADGTAAAQGQRGIDSLDGFQFHDGGVGRGGGRRAGVRRWRGEIHRPDDGFSETICRTQQREDGHGLTGSRDVEAVRALGGRVALLRSIGGSVGVVGAQDGEIDALFDCAWCLVR